MSSAPTVFLGTYATSGGGLRPVDVDGGLRLGMPEANIRNASFAAVDRARGLVHFVDEQDEGLVRTCRPTTHGWEILAERPTHGKAPCYIALDAAGARLAVANYGSGSLALFSIDPASGVPESEPELWQSDGSGPVADRQEGPHLHCALFAEGQLFAVDLGSDRIFAFDVRQGLSEPWVAFAAPSGSGPRHLVFHPRLPLAYLVSELAATVTILHREGSRLTAGATLPTAPVGYRGDNLGGHIALGRGGTRLYVTNRGHDSVAVFAVGTDGMLELLQHVSSRGASPRSFVLLEREGLCLVANEEAETLVCLPLDGDGLLGEARDVVDAPGAAFVLALGAAGDE